MKILELLVAIIGLNELPETNIFMQNVVNISPQFSCKILASHIKFITRDCQAVPGRRSEFGTDTCAIRGRLLQREEGDGDPNGEEC